MDEVKRFVGIDVAKVALDVFIGPAGVAFSVANDEVGIRELLRQLKPADFVILEATGGLEAPVASALATAGIAVAIVNPRQVRDFARATGRLAKTDRLDAEVLARFGEAVRPESRPLANEQAQALEALVTRRRQLVEMLRSRTSRGTPLRAEVRGTTGVHPSSEPTDTNATHINRWIYHVPSFFIGSSNSMVTPQSRFFVTHSWPSWPSMIERTIGRPIPMPWRLVVKKGSKIRGIIRSRIFPGPARSNRPRFIAKPCCPVAGQSSATAATALPQARQMG